MPRAVPRKRRRSGEGSIYWNTSLQRFQATIHMGYDAQGKRIRRTFTGKTEDEVAERLAGAQADYRKGTLAAPSRDTVEDFFTTWVEENASIGTEAGTWREYKAKLRLYVYPNIGVLRLNTLTAQHVQALVARLRRTVSKRTDKPLSASTIKAVYRILHMALGKRIDWTEVKLPKVEDYEGAILEPEDFTKLMQAAAGTPYELVWHLMAMGLRPEEVLGLRKQDIDFNRGQITIREVIPTKGPRTPKVPKTRGSRRPVTLPSQTVALLSDYCQGRAQAMLRSGGRVFVNDDGSPWEWTGVYRKGWLPLFQVAQVPYVRPYSLRHGAASYWIDEGIPLPEVSATLGHSNTATTARIYAHRLKRAETRPAASVGRLLPLPVQETSREG